MGSISKSFSLILIVLLAVSSLIMAKPAFAQSTEPSPPNFTIQISSTSTIQLVIENQAFVNTSSVNSVVYYCRFKDHNSDSWIQDGDYTLQSNSGTTIISIPPVPGMPFSILKLDNGTLLDFQVQAVTGFYSITWEPGYMPDAPTQFQSGNGYNSITFTPAESSEWSPTQTVTITATPLSPTPVPSSSTSTLTPTPTLTSVSSSLNSSLLLIALAVIAFLLVVIISLLIYMRKRRIAFSQTKVTPTP